MSSLFQSISINTAATLAEVITAEAQTTINLAANNELFSKTAEVAKEVIIAVSAALTMLKASSPTTEFEKRAQLVNTTLKTIKKLEIQVNKCFSEMDLEHFTDDEQLEALVSNLEAEVISLSMLNDLGYKKL